jgi:hypothetical protein
MILFMSYSDKLKLIRNEKFFCIAELFKFDTQSIFNVVKNIGVENNFFKKIAVFASDNASTVASPINGVSGELEEIFGYLISKSNTGQGHALNLS